MADDDEELGKAEPSRWHTGAGHFPTFSAHKLRALAASGRGELNAMQREVSRMSRTQSEDGAYDGSIRLEPHVITLQDVTRGLGLEYTDAARVEKHVNETLPTFSQKTQTQRIFHARASLLSLLRDSMKHVEADTRDELVRRAVAYWKRNYQTDYGVTPTVRFRGGAAGAKKSMSDEEPIPVLTVDRIVRPPSSESPVFVIPLEKARGGKYYRRIPTGNPKRPWRYFYTRESYERAHGKDGHLHGPEVLASRRGKGKKKPRSIEGQLGFEFGSAPVEDPKAPPETPSSGTPRPDPTPPEPREEVEPKPGDPLPLASAQVTHAQIEAEAKGLADELGLKSEVYVAAYRRKHALLGHAHDIVVRSKGKAIKEGKKLLEKIRERWFAAGPLDYREARIGAHGGSSGYADGSVLTLRIWPDAKPGSSFSDIQLREDAGRDLAPGDPEQGRAFAAQVIDAARSEGGNAHGLIDQLVESGDLRAIQSARTTLSAAYRAAKATLREIDKIKTTRRSGGKVYTGYGIRHQTDHPRYSEYQEALRSERVLKATWNRLDKVLNQAPPKISPEEKPRKRPSGPSGESVVVSPEHQKLLERIQGLARFFGSEEKVLEAHPQLREQLHAFEAKAAVSPEPAEPKFVVPGPPPEPPEPTPPPPRPKPEPGGSTTSGPSGPSTAGKKPKPPSAPKGTPRGDAEKQTAEDLESNFLNDRKSKVEQRGEDVAGSARHKAMEWKSLSQALDSSDAGKMFTRKFLEREQPHDLISKTQKSDAPMHLLFLHFITKKFPTKPVKLTKGRSDELGTWFVNRDAPSDYLLYGKHFSEKRAEYRAMSADQKKALQAEYDRDQRAGYHAAYETLHGIIEKHASSASPSDDFRQFTNAVRRDISQAMNAVGGKGSTAAALTASSRNKFAAEALRKIANSGGRIKGELMEGAEAKDPLSLLKEKWSKAELMKHRFREVGMTIMEGKSINAAFGVKAERGRKFDVTEAYDTDVMRRAGPQSEYHSVTQGLDMLDGSAGGKYGMRAVQWGRSVTDGERAHHLKSCVDSFNDLTDVLGLPPQMASYNGKLAIAIGARGKGNALAHYEPRKKIINLTRAGGAGSLAHEWGHFFDYMVHAVTPGPGNVRGIDGGAFEDSRHEATTSSTHHAMRDLAESESYRKFSQRITGVAYGRFGEKAAQYWTSDREQFARCFERYVQRKLHASGRENTYLVAVRKSASSEEGLWPTDEEIDAMTPHFDTIFKAFRESDLLHKALAWLGYIRPEYAHLVKGKPMFTIPRGR